LRYNRNVAVSTKMTAALCSTRFPSYHVSNEAHSFVTRTLETYVPRVRLCAFWIYFNTQCSAKLHVVLQTLRIIRQLFLIKILSCHKNTVIEINVHDAHIIAYQPFLILSHMYVRWSLLKKACGNMQLIL